MKKLLLVAALFVCAATPAAAGSGQQSMAGGGSRFEPVGMIDEEFTVGAYNDALGQNPQGAITLQTVPTVGSTQTQTFHGNVKDGCMFVIANPVPGNPNVLAHGYAVGRLPASEQFDVVTGTGVRRITSVGIFVEDNGEPQMGQPVDRANALLLFQQTAERVCDRATNTLVALAGDATPISQGNFVLQAATP